MSNPFRADSDVETETTSGMARPSACGQAMTMTLTVRDSAKSASSPMMTSQAMRVANPTVTAVMVRKRAARSARF